MSSFKFKKSTMKEEEKEENDTLNTTKWRYLNNHITSSYPAIAISVVTIDILSRQASNISF